MSLNKERSWLKGLLDAKGERGRGYTFSVDKSLYDRLSEVLRNLNIRQTTVLEDGKYKTFLRQGCDDTDVIVNDGSLSDQWLEAFFNARGSIRLIKRNEGYNYYIEVCSSDRVIIEKYQSILRGMDIVSSILESRPPRKPLYKVRISKHKDIRYILGRIRIYETNMAKTSIDMLDYLNRRVGP
jgi:DNA-binding transcriptional regulator WhiA